MKIPGAMVSGGEGDAWAKEIQTGVGVEKWTWAGVGGQHVWMGILFLLLSSQVTFPSVNLSFPLSQMG